MEGRISIIEETIYPIPRQIEMPIYLNRNKLKIWFQALQYISNINALCAGVMFIIVSVTLSSLYV